MRELPRGTVTFLFTDIEGSTRLLHELGDRYADVLAEHRRVLRDAFERHGGVEVDTQGDAFFAAFARASDAVTCAAAVQEALAEEPIRVRMGIHAGEPIVTGEGYVGVDVHRAARIAAAGHGGQVLLSQTTRDLVGPEGLRDLGEHRLKDLTRSERLFQLGDEAFPPIKSLSRVKLPLTAGPLFGRATELADVVGLLQGGARLVTVTGPGGIGKTRLTLQVAAELSDTLDVVAFVPLAGLADAQLVPAAIAQILELDADQVPPLAAVAEYLTGRRSVLVLDNAEHLSGVAAIVADLLEAADGTSLLVSSRAPLHLTAEHEYVLDSLALAAATTLFVERGRSVRRGIEADATVEELCRRLDRLPLALELAAARLRVLDAAGLLAHLERTLPLLVGGAADAPARQRTLEATIAWSYDLLSPHDRDLFEGLGVFAGTFAAEAAEAVVGAELNALERLIEASLLKSVEGGRFLMLQTIREFALDRLEQHGRGATLRAKLLSWLLRFAREAHAEKHGTRQSLVLEAARAEHENVWAMLDWCVKQGEWEDALTLAALMASFWQIQGHAWQGKSWLEAALEDEREVTPGVRAAALRMLAELLDWQGEPREALRRFREARALFEQEGNRSGVARCDNGIAWELMCIGDLPSALEVAERGLGEAESVEDDVIAAGVRNTLGAIELRRGNFGLARGHHARSLEMHRRRGDAINETAALLNLGSAYFLEGDHATARLLLDEALALARELGAHAYAATAAYWQARVAVAVGDRQLAQQLLRQSLSSCRLAGDRGQAAGTLQALAAVAADAGRGPDAGRLWLASEAVFRESGLATAEWDDFPRTTLASVRAAFPGLDSLPAPSLAEAYDLVLGPESGSDVDSGPDGPPG